MQYPAKIVDGVLKIVRRKDFDKEIACQKDMYCFVTIEKASKKRSSPQNRYYWGVVVPLVRKGFLENGWESYELSSDQVHDCIKHKFCRTELVNHDTGEIIESVKGTSEMTTSEFMDFIVIVQQWSATFFNIDIPDPNQEWFIQELKD